MANTDHLNNYLASQECFQLASLAVLQVSTKSPQHGEDEGLGERHELVVIKTSPTNLILTVTVFLHSQLLFIPTFILLVLFALRWPLLNVCTLCTLWPISLDLKANFDIEMVPNLSLSSRQNTQGHNKMYEIVAQRQRQHSLVNETHDCTLLQSTIHPWIPYLALFSSDCCMQGNIASSKTKRV